MTLREILHIDVKNSCKSRIEREYADGEETPEKFAASTAKYFDLPFCQVVYLFG